MGCGSSTENTPSSRLPQNTKPEDKDSRANEIEKRRPEYEMDYTDWLPPAVKKLPSRDVQMSSAKEFVDIFFNMRGKAIALEWNAFEQNFTKDDDPNVDPYSRFTDVFPKKNKWIWEGVERDVPEVSKRWKTDEEFARQRLCGNVPYRIRIWDPAVLSKFKLTDAHVSAVVEGQTIESLAAAKRLFYVDSAMLAGGGIENLVHQPTEGYWVAPIAAFYTTESKTLMPLAIQLQQEDSDSDDNPIWTPKNCNDATWTLAKMFYQQSEASLHESCYHLMQTHMISEVFYDCCQRQMSCQHPIYELLDAHFWGTLLINESARKNLFSPEGQLPTYFTQGYEGLKEMIRRMNHSNDFCDWVPEEDLKRRGLDDPSILPEFYWRDDSLRLYNLVHDYITEFVNLVYATDKDIEADWELQAWAADFNYKTEYWKNVPTVSKKFQNKAQLIRLLTIVIYGCSGRHATVNNGQYDLMAFVPNCPATIFIPPPKRSDAYTLTHQRVAYDGLAPSDLVRIQISFFHAVSTPTQPSKRLGQYPSTFLSYSEDAQAMVKRFQDKLTGLSNQIQQRNKDLESKGKVGYVYQDPWQVACGVAI